jgi:hypothetical protein
MWNEPPSPRPNYRLILSGLLIIAVCVAAVVYYWPEFQNPLAGPQPISQAELSKLNDVNQLRNRWVEIPVTGARDTGIRLVEETRDKEESKYVLLEIGDRYLFAQVNPDFLEGPGPKITGILKVLSSQGYIGDAVDQFRAAEPEQAARLLPLLLEADRYSMVDVYSFNAVMVVGVLLGGKMSFIGLRGGTLRKYR